MVKKKHEDLQHWISAVDPISTNDGVDTAGLGRIFLVEDKWFNTVSGLAWRCTANTTSAAVWEVDTVMIQSIGNGMTIQRPVITLRTATGNIYADVEAEGGGDLIFQIGNKRYTLDCTTGGGAGGKATVLLTEGTSTVPQRNYVYIVETAGAGVLTASTSLPTGEFVWISYNISVLDDITHGTVGPLGLQRVTDSYDISAGRGALSYQREKLRALGALWESGVSQALTITTNPASPDNLVFTSTAGKIYQLHLQDFPAFSGTPTLYIANHNTTPYVSITDLNSANQQADGTAFVDNDRFNLVIWGVINQTTGDCKLFVNLPIDVYVTDADALSDHRGTAVTTIPTWANGVGFIICRIALKYNTANSGTWVNLSGGTAVIDLRSLHPGFNLGGTNVPASTEFTDDLFRVLDNIDATKKLAFQVANIATTTTRTMTMPDADVDLTQIANIGAATISGTQWGYLGAMDQGVAIGDSVGFVNAVFTGYIEFTDIAAPGAPGAGLGRLYKKTGNDGLFWMPDAAGPEVDLTAGGGGTPGGSDTQLQYNNVGSFGGIAGLTWNATDLIFNVSTKIDNTEGLKFKELASSPTEVAGYGLVYVKTDGKLYFKNDTPTEYDLLAGGSDESVKVSPDDASAGDLETKILGTANKIVLTTNNPGAAETRQINVGTDILDLAATGQIVAVTEKTAPIKNDEFLIEDSAASNAKKSVKLINLPGNKKLLIINVDGGGGTIKTARYIAGKFRAPWACTMTKITLLANDSGSILVSFYKTTYANYPTTSPVNMEASGTNAPEIVSAFKNEVTVFTGWTSTTFVVGDCLRTYIESVTTLKDCTILIELEVD